MCWQADGSNLEFEILDLEFVIFKSYAITKSAINLNLQTILCLKEEMF